MWLDVASALVFWAIGDKLSHSVDAPIFSLGIPPE